MARIQILELPQGEYDERPPFALIIDQAREATVASLQRQAAMRDDPAAYHPLADQVGARCVLFFTERVDIPANEYGLTADGNVVRYHAEGDAESIPRAEDNLKAFMDKRYEVEEKRKASLTDALGMDRLRDWDDILNAAAGLRKERDAQAETLERVRNLPVEPETMDAQHEQPQGYIHGYGVAIREARRVTFTTEAVSDGD